MTLLFSKNSQPRTKTTPIPNNDLLIKFRLSIESANAIIYIPSNKFVWQKRVKEITLGTNSE
jgi:hypothetical protein